MCLARKMITQWTTSAIFVPQFCAETEQYEEFWKETTMKKWLFDHFLPMWAKETVLADNRRLKRENQRLSQLVEQKDAYIQGLQLGIRAGKRISIYNRGGDA